MLVIRSEYGLTDFEPWGGAVDTFNLIKENGKLQKLEYLLEDTYFDGITEAALNDLLWHDSDWILESLGLSEFVYSSTSTKKRAVNAAFAEASANEDAYYTMLNFIADRFDVNGPLYRGAPQPIFDPAKVNESFYADNMRCKQFDCEVKDDELHIWYLTQEPFTQTEALECDREIQRCIDYLYDKFCEKTEESVDAPYVYLTIECRDGRKYGYYETAYV